MKYTESQVNEIMAIVEQEISDKHPPYAVKAIRERLMALSEPDTPDQKRVWLLDLGPNGGWDVYDEKPDLPNDWLYVATLKPVEI